MNHLNIIICILICVFHMESLCNFNSVVKDCPPCCVCYNRYHRLSCIGQIPVDIPKNFTDVAITSFNGTFDSRNFSGKNWECVEHLEIYDNLGVGKPHFNIRTGTFVNLIHLTYLKLQLHTVNEFDDGAFDGLPRLYSLVLHDVWRLTWDNVLKTFRNRRAFPNLKSLQIDSLNTFKLEPPTVIDAPAVKAIALRNISELRLHMYIESITVPIYDNLAPSLEKVDLSSSYVNEITIVPLPLARSIWYLNLSNCKDMWGFEGVQVSDKVYDLTKWAITVRIFKHLKTVIIDNLITLSPTIFKHVTILLPSVNADLRHLSFRNNMLHYLDVVSVTHQNPFRNLTHIELQDNGMEYLNPAFMCTIPNLQILNISNNSLGIMQTENTSSFSNFTFCVRNLEILDMSFNKLQEMPMNFSNDLGQLKILNLNNNKLTQFAQLKVLNLTTLDLSWNIIGYLDTKSMKWLDAVEDLSGNNLHVNLLGNPIQCKCENIEFLTWFTSSRMFHSGNTNYTCYINGRHRSLNTDFVKGLKHDCTRGERLKLYLKATIIPCVCVITILVCSIVVHHRIERRKHQLRTLNNNITKLRQGNHDLKYPVFLSFSSEDGDYVFREIYPRLLHGLRAAVGVNTDLVCVGDLHFRPGYRVHDEIIRCLEASGVFMAVITPSYCRRPFCQNEFDQAHAMRKPVLQLFIDDVDKDDMWPFLRQNFERYTRIKVIQSDVTGDVDFHPDVETICKAILERM